MREAALERSRRDAPKPLLKLENRGHVTGQGQVKVKNEHVRSAMY